MPTHSHFADWYRSAALAPPAGLLDKRWAAVEDVANTSDAARVLKLAELFTLPNVNESNVPEGLREVFQTHDDTFQFRDNLRELQVLAGAILRLIIEQRGGLSPLAALALVCGGFGSREATLVERGHLDLAQRFLVQLSTTARRCDRPEPIAVPGQTGERLGDLIPSVGVNQSQILRDSVIKALSRLVSEFSSALEQVQTAIEGIARASDVREEELALLWWIQTHFSRDLEKPFSEIGYVAGSIVLPSELADLTRFIPGPEAVVGVLALALQLAGAPSSKETATIATAINSTPRAWRKTLCGRINVGSCESLTPVLLAILKSLETDGPNDWLPVYRKACDIPLDRPFPLVQLSLQLFRERMLLRATREVKK